MTTTRTLAALVAGLALTGLGTAVALGDDRGPTAAPAAVSLLAAGTTSATPVVPPTGAETPRKTAADAARIARSHVGGAAATTVERETEHGRPVWEVDVRGATGTTRVHVDTATGTVTRVEDARGRAGEDRAGDDRNGHDRSRDDGEGGRHGGDDGPGHDLGDDRGGDR